MNALQVKACFPLNEGHCLMNAALCSLLRTSAVYAVCYLAWPFIRNSSPMINSTSNAVCTVTWPERCIMIHLLACSLYFVSLADYLCTFLNRICAHTSLQTRGTFLMLMQQIGFLILYQTLPHPAEIWRLNDSIWSALGKRPLCRNLTEDVSQCSYHKEDTHLLLIRSLFMLIWYVFALLCEVLPCLNFPIKWLDIIKLLCKDAIITVLKPRLLE